MNIKYIFSVWIQMFYYSRH